MAVESPEIIRKKAKLSKYKMAQLLDITQINYQQIVDGKIKRPASNVGIGLVVIAVLFSGYSFESAVTLVGKDLDVSIDIIKARAEIKRKKK